MENIVVVGSTMRFHMEKEGERPDILFIKEPASSFSSCEGGSSMGLNCTHTANQVAARCHD